MTQQPNQPNKSNRKLKGRTMTNPFVAVFAGQPIARDELSKVGAAYDQN